MILLLALTWSTFLNTLSLCLPLLLLARVFVFWADLADADIRMLSPLAYVKKHPTVNVNKFNGKSCVSNLCSILFETQSQQETEQAL